MHLEQGTKGISITTQHTHTFRGGGRGPLSRGRAPSTPHHQEAQRGVPHQTTDCTLRGGGAWVCSSLNGAAVCGHCVSDRESKDMMSILCDTIVFITDDIISFKNGDRACLSWHNRASHILCRLEVFIQDLSIHKAKWFIQELFLGGGGFFAIVNRHN